MKTINPHFEIITPIDEQDILKKIEAVGRTCYKSEDKITDDSCVSFAQRLIQRGHEAMIEHVSVSVRVFCDRGVSHEIVRHRIASYVQESTRFCNYGNEKFGGDVTYLNIRGGMELDPKVGNLPAEKFEAIYEEWMQSCRDAEAHYIKMLELGATPQIARSVLNNSTKTEIVITMSLREWRAFFKLRTAPAAHPSMREIAIPLLKEFKSRIPVIFDDLEVA